jgi:2-dehydro-3-deoxyphosphooctonate aldolase (KDO 8-P synthase)
MGNVINKLQEAGTRKIFLTERGASFGYQNLVVDMRALPVMRNFGYPVVFDATHSVQLPGGGGTRSSGQREFVAPLARAAAAVGCDGFFMEVHPRPEEALSDGPNMVRLSELRGLLQQIQAIWVISGKGETSPLT